MKRTDFKAKSSVLYLGKGIVILSLVIASSLGFILGFFVGKSVQSTDREHSSVIAPLDVAVQQNVPPDEGVLAPEQQPSEEVPQSEMENLQEVTEVPKPHATKEPQGPQKTRQVQENKMSLKNKKDSHAPADKNAQKDHENQKTSKTRRYTVQAGAFNNPDEADALKSALTKKGFRAFTVEAKAKNKRTLHKVMVGEYRNRKEAEVLSLKLKKSEGLRAFVTIKTE